MNLLLDNREILDLGKGLQGVRVECRGGRCWLTQSGDNRDHILGAGDAFTVRTQGRLIITAMEPCRLMLLHTEPRGRQQHPSKMMGGVLKSCVAGVSRQRRALFSG